MNILLVDDDPVTRHVVQGVLDSLGHAVTITVDGADAWDAWQREHNRIVVADWMMPAPDGLELCRRMRRVPAQPYTYFILLTGRTGRENRHTALDAGVDDFLTKPLDPDELSARVAVAERILGLRRELSQYQTLLSMCSHCRRVLGPAGKWLTLEDYLAQHAQTGMSHDICPDCYRKHWGPDLEKLAG